MQTTESKNKAEILNGQILADIIKVDLKKKIEKDFRRPGLAAILIGDDPASDLYIKLKEKASETVGIEFHKYICNQNCCSNISEEEILQMIDFLNRDGSIDAIIVQLPLPEYYNTQKIINAISPDKDVDGFHPLNNKVTPPTIDSIIELLKETKENLADKKTLIIGKSQIFIDGIEKYLKKNLGINSINASEKIPENCQKYDIVIIALGQAYALKKESVKSGAIIIDVGINKLDGKTVGDVDPCVMEVASYISPVPGGVGPLTVACLLRNAYLLSLK
ncbi:MAG: tetrahydrofolate dehydrogenase/cyclohydrolase catalytic domain-containing protein [Candidatus Buchananbacteria bacterium]